VTSFLSLLAVILVPLTNGVSIVDALDQVASARARDPKADIVLEIGVKGRALSQPISIDRVLQPEGAGIMKKLRIHPLVMKNCGLYVNEFRPKLPKEAEGCAQHPEWICNPSNHINPPKEWVNSS